MSVDKGQRSGLLSLIGLKEISQEHMQEILSGGEKHSWGDNFSRTNGMKYLVDGLAWKSVEIFMYPSGQIVITAHLILMHPVIWFMANYQKKKTWHHHELYFTLACKLNRNS